MFRLGAEASLSGFNYCARSKIRRFPSTPLNLLQMFRIDEIGPVLIDVLDGRGVAVIIHRPFHIASATWHG